MNKIGESLASIAMINCSIFMSIASPNSSPHFELERQPHNNLMNKGSFMRSSLTSKTPSPELAVAPQKSMISRSICVGYDLIRIIRRCESVRTGRLGSTFRLVTSRNCLTVVGHDTNSHQIMRSGS